MLASRVKPSASGSLLHRFCGCYFTRRHESQTVYTKPSPKEYDMVGPPDLNSNIRKMAFARRANETPREQGFRMMKEFVHSWHHDFWTRHNKNFNESKKKFLEGKEKKSSKQAADELSVFYKDFLDKNYQLHKEYQWEAFSSPGNGTKRM
ncbi:COA8 family protein CBG23705, mitochondrial isoform X2 [Nematostella vectensis]|uniref:COA8 family protein CBG23705, mitochondrial isoform X2 n=1 Tax=Nematostella vectensis TaxID=45351 RepID=UPI0020774E60|nr:COA8 family protein CBG23705, mitochondrial isoform X2 [Nematostella vectensis]